MLIGKNLGVTFGKTEIFRGMDYSAAPGQVAAIVGPNGSGKTTLLRVLTGEIAATGSVHLNGHDVAATPPWALAEMRAVLPQATNLSFPFNVVEVVRLGHSDRHSTDVARHALARVGLSGYETRFYQELSGGEKQRVHLARVLTQIWEPLDNGEPRWLFLDEPVSALDIGHQMQVMQIARDFAKAGGGVVAVMHDLNLTAMYADQITVLEGGRILGHGSAQDVMTQDILSKAYDCPLRPGFVPASDLFVLPQSVEI